ncbi:protein mono-ADP-ribosyltransferase PARP4-like isoform X2 [Pecten maximus]|uniref:protein mono-ADP-ribosyltransferase PARP4-like isoform X2 n=1 Tax=Pecten maximus TaxID=6579 RepID=UPI001458A6C8|nr:protein mono-ADP-ribosyltransferase PARP4-like isoform X2 [Pecten maximus]
MATVFGGCHVVLDLTTSVNFKKKQEIRKKITENDGIVSYIVTKQSTHVICNDPAKADISYKCKMAQKYGIPVVSVSFLYDCVEKGRLLSTDDYLVVGKTRSQKLGSGRIAATKYQILGKRKKSSFYPGGVKAWPLQEKHTPIFNSTKYQVAKYAVLKKYVKSAGRTFFCVLEVHVTEERDLLPGQIYRFRVSKHHGNLKNIQEGKPEKMECYYVETSEEATKMYSFLYKQQTDPPNLMEVSHDAPPRGVGTLNFQKMMVTFGLEKAELSTPVCELVEGIWKEAYSDLSDILTSPSSVKLEQIEKAEALLMKLRSQPEDKESVLSEFYSTLPHNTKVSVSGVNNAWLSSEQDICQVMKDMLTVSEATGWSLRGSTESKYRALRCQIEHRAPDHHVYKTVKALVNKSLDGSTRLNIVNVFEVQRQMEEDNFTDEIYGQTLLFHASKPNNFVGILSRGLLMPKMVVDDFGGKRTDAGMLGAGIYFASAASTSVKYSQVSKSRGTRMMLVNKVALGKCMDLYKHDQTLTKAPDGYFSVHGVAKTSNKPSDFTEDEYVVYSPDQQKMCYLVEFTVGSEIPKPMDIVPTEDAMDMNTQATFDKINLKDVKDVLDPMSKVKSGLVADGKEVNPVELEDVNVFAKMMDLVAEVKVLQVYHNKSNEMLEGKYVFPLDEMAAVCGFEAYINDKHVVGEVKEKETAHKEYKKAISEGHGAYLMDQDEESPDVFTVSVGNVPAKATVVIKITYVTELQVEGDLVSFRLPGTLAPWKQNSQNTEDIECTVMVAVDMPFDLKNIHSPTHKIMIADFDGGKAKRVDSRKLKGSTALVVMDPDLQIGEGFHLLLELAEAHVPRMWVEQNEENTSNQACMLTFYPEFEACEDNQAEVILMLDLSNSMTDKGLTEAKKVLLLILHYLPKTWTFNVIIFGTTFRELFPSSQPKNKSNATAAEVLIQSVDANMGNTDLYRPLHSFYLLKPENTLRNIFLVSDGHINHQDVTMDTVHKNSQHTRVFTFGVSNVMNRHLLGALARVGSGAFEGFDSKVKSKWEDKVKSQIAKAGQPGLTSVAVSWQQEDGAPPPKQAPNQITALFSGSRMVVYGFVQNCSSATLTAEIGDQEITALVTKSDRYVTKGKILHRLAAKAIIRDWEDGLLSPDGLNQQRMKMDLKDYVIKLSKEFCIVTQLTSFIAVEKREKDEKMTSAPDIEELLETEHRDVCAFLGPDISPDELMDVLSSDDTESLHRYLTDESSDESSDSGEFEEEGKGQSYRRVREVESSEYSDISSEWDGIFEYESMDEEMMNRIMNTTYVDCCLPHKSEEEEEEEEEGEEEEEEEEEEEGGEEEEEDKDEYMAAPVQVKKLEPELFTMPLKMQSATYEEYAEPCDMYGDVDMEVEQSEAAQAEIEISYAISLNVDARKELKEQKSEPLTSSLMRAMTAPSEESEDDDMAFGLFDDGMDFRSERKAKLKDSVDDLLDLSADLETDTIYSAPFSASEMRIGPPPSSQSAMASRSAGLPPQPAQPAMMALKSAESRRPAQSFIASERAAPPPPPPPPSKPTMSYELEKASPKLAMFDVMADESRDHPPPVPLLAMSRGAPPPPGGPPPVPLNVINKGAPPPVPLYDTLGGSPPPIPQGRMRGLVRRGIELTPHSAIAMKSTRSPPQQAKDFTSAIPPPPPPQQAQAFTSPIPPPPPDQQQAQAFTSTIPPPPPQQQAQAFTSPIPPPPPPQQAKTFISAGSSPPKSVSQPPIFARKMSSEKNSFKSDANVSIAVPLSLDLDLLEVESSTSMPSVEEKSVVIEEEQPKNPYRKKKKQVAKDTSVSWRSCEKSYPLEQTRGQFSSQCDEQSEPADGKRMPQSLRKSRGGAVERSKVSGCMGSSPQPYDDSRERRYRGLHVDGDWFQDLETPQEQRGFFAKVKTRKSMTEKPQDLSDIGTKMPIIAKSAKKNLSKKELDTLKRLQNKLGGWTRSEVEKELFINLSVCIKALNAAGLKSLGMKVAMEMENVLVTAFVVMWILKTLAPELFPLNTSVRSWSDTAVEVAAAALEIYDHDRSLLNKAINYCNQIERAHPGVSSTLELGPNWFEVASKILGF